MSIIYDDNNYDNDNSSNNNSKEIRVYHRQYPTCKAFYFRYFMEREAFFTADIQRGKRVFIMSSMNMNNYP